MTYNVFGGTLNLTQQLMNILSQEREVVKSSYFVHMFPITNVTSSVILS